MQRNPAAQTDLRPTYDVSNGCREAMHSLQAAAKSGKSTVEGCDRYCGILPAAPVTTPTFAQRLSAQCAAYFDTVRAANATHLGLKPGHERGLSRKRRCAKFSAGTRGTNPVVVHRHGALPFVIGAVPKAGSTNLHKLTLALVAHRPYRKAPPGGVRVPMSMNTIHLNVYPAVWHYEQPLGVLEAGRLPSFLVSRNPYQRLVSCYLVRPMSVCNAAPHAFAAIALAQTSIKGHCIA